MISKRLAIAIFVPLIGATLAGTVFLFNWLAYGGYVPAQSHFAPSSKALVDAAIKVGPNASVSRSGSWNAPEVQVQPPQPKSTRTAVTAKRERKPLGFKQPTEQARHGSVQREVRLQALPAQVAAAMERPPMSPIEQEGEEVCISSGLAASSSCPYSVIRGSEPRGVCTECK